MAIIGVPLPPYMKLSAEDSPKSDDAKVEMAKIPYASAVGSFMYATVAMHPGEVVSRYIAIANPCNKHWLCRCRKSTSGYVLH